MSQSRRLEPERQTLQVARASYPALHDLIRRGLLLPIDRLPQHQDPLTGVRRLRSYRLADPTEFQLLDDHRARIGSVEITADFDHLPSPAYQAVTRASGAFRQFADLPELLCAARTPGQTAAWVGQLIEDTVERGRHSEQPHGLFVPPRQFHSRWRPAEIVFHETKRDFFLSLAFDTTFRRLSRAAVTTRIGLDLGFDPLSVAVHEDGTVQAFRPTPLTVPSPRLLSPGGRALRRQVLYASGRQDAERILAHLTHRAHHVYAEQLTHRGMSRSFVYGARDHAVHDYHFSWLSQFLNVAGIPFTRVDPAGTSITCPRPACRHRDPGNRRGRHFVCLNCGYRGDADAIGAGNVLSRGISERP